MVNDMRRALIYLLYDPEGRVDISVRQTLSAFRSVADYILVVSNGPLKEDAKAALREGLADHFLERENSGFDVGAYQAAFRYLTSDDLAGFDALILANSTFFTVTESFQALFNRMESEGVDMWGMTDHPQVHQHPRRETTSIPAHLQTYWLVFGSSILQGPDFLPYWETLEYPTTYDEVVRKFETQLTRHFDSRGYTWKAAYPAADFGVNNPSMEAPLQLLEAGCPIIKKRLYFHGTDHLMHQGVSVARVTRRAVEKGLSHETIVDAVRNRTDSTQLSIALGALHVVTRPKSPSQEIDQPTLTLERAERRVWKQLALGEDHFLTKKVTLVLPHSEPIGSDGSMWRLQNAESAFLTNPSELLHLFQQQPKLGMLAPLLQFVGTAESDLAWLPQARKGWEVAKQLGLQVQASHHGPISAYRGIAMYRVEALRAFGKRIRDAGGWHKLVKIAGGDAQLEVILDQLVADQMLVEGFYAGQVTTPEELEVESPLWMVEAQAHFARFNNYSTYMHKSNALPAYFNRDWARWTTSDNRIVYRVLENAYVKRSRLYQIMNSVYYRASNRIAKRDDGG